MSKTFNKNIPYTFSGAINLSTSAGLNISNDSNTIGSIITTGGNVGIGTTAPSSLFDISGYGFSRVFAGSAFALNLQNFSNTASRVAIGSSSTGGNQSNVFELYQYGLPGLTNQAGLRLSVSSGNSYNIMSYISGNGSLMPINLGHNSIPHLTVQTSGNVGIGTTSPTYKLDVDGDINVNSTDGNQAGYITTTKESTFNNKMVIQAARGLGGILFNLVNQGNVMSIVQGINSAGNVGIGTTSPGSALHVNGTIGSTPIGTGVHMGTDSVNNASIIQINQGGSTSGTAIMDFGYSGANYVSRIIHDNNTKSLTILVNGGVDRVTIASTGNVGIGTNSPAYTLDVTGSLRSTGDIFIGNGTAAEALNLWDIPGAAWQLSTGGYNLSIRNGTVGSTMVDRVTIASTGNVGIGTTTPIGKMSVDYNGISANQNVLSLHTSNTATNDYNLIEAGHGASTTFVLKGNGNVGIGTTSPAFTLDVNGTIARSGVKLPRYNNGSFSGSASFSIPILFNDTQYNYAEFRVRYITSAICNMNISATSYASVAMNFSECALTTVKWNAQGTPVYATFSNVTSGIFADTVEMVGIDNNLIFRITRATGTSSAGLRNQYSYDNVYCWSGVGTARGYGQGWISNGTVGGSPLQFVTFTCSTGTVSGTYSTVHYY